MNSVSVQEELTELIGRLTASFIHSLKRRAKGDRSTYHSSWMGYDKQYISLNTEGINEARILLLQNPVGIVCPKSYLSSESLSEVYHIRGDEISSVSA